MDGSVIEAKPWEKPATGEPGVAFPWPLSKSTWILGSLSNAALACARSGAAAIGSGRHLDPRGLRLRRVDARHERVQLRLVGLALGEVDLQQVELVLDLHRVERVDVRAVRERRVERLGVREVVRHERAGATGLLVLPLAPTRNVGTLILWTKVARRERVDHVAGVVGLVRLDLRQAGRRLWPCSSWLSLQVCVAGLDAVARPGLAVSATRAWRRDALLGPAARRSPC